MAAVTVPQSVRDAAATLRQQTIQNHVLGHAAPSGDRAARGSTLTGQVRDALLHGGRQSWSDTLDELDRLDRLRDAYTGADAHITRRVTELRTGFRDASPPGPDVDRRAGQAAHIMADAEHAKAINQVRNTGRTPGRPAGGLSARLEQVRRDAETAAQEAAKQAGRICSTRSRPRTTPARSATPTTSASGRTGTRRPWPCRSSRPGPIRRRTTPRSPTRCATPR